jgi:Ala-tRNA(Pro) deacylase
MTTLPPDTRTLTSPVELLRMLGEFGIETLTVTHPPVLTIAESRAVRGDLPGTHCKNLLLQDRRGACFLVVVTEDRRLDLKALAARLGTARLSFADPEVMARLLGVGAGTATPFAVVNDLGSAVRVVLEESLLHEQWLNFHPLVNTMTTAIAPADLLRFLEATGHPPLLIP